MPDLNETGNRPEGMNNAEAKPEGISMFFGDQEAAFFTSAGREITETILSEFFLLYRIDLEKTQTDFYGQSKKKVFLPEVKIYGRINVEAKSPENTIKGGIEKKGMGNLTAHIYLTQLEELGLIEKRENTNIIVTGIKSGHFIGYKGQFYKIFNDGYSQIANEFSWAGDRRFYITVEAVEVDEDIFKGR